MNSQEQYNVLQLQHKLQSYQFQYNDLQIKYELFQLQSQCEIYQRELEAFRTLFYSVQNNMKDPLYSIQSVKNVSSTNAIQAPKLSSTQGNIFPNVGPHWMTRPNQDFKRNIDRSASSIEQVHEDEASIIIENYNDIVVNKSLEEKKST